MVHLAPDFGLTDTYVVDNKFTPGETTGWHSHPGPSLIIVVDGTITNYDSDQKHCAGVSYSKGESFVDSGGSDVHTLVNQTYGERRDDRRPVHPERSAATCRPADRTSQLPRPVSVARLSLCGRIHPVSDGRLKSIRIDD